MYEKHIEKVKRYIAEDMLSFDRIAAAPALYSEIWRRLKPLAELQTFLEFKRDEYHKLRIIEGAKNEARQKNSNSTGEGSEEEAS